VDSYVCVVDADSLLLPRMLYSFFFLFLISVSDRNLHLILFRARKQARSSTQCAQWPQFNSRSNVFRKSDLRGHEIRALQNFSPKQSSV